MASSPSMMNSLCVSDKAAVSGRIAVPAFPKNSARVLFEGGNRPPSPWIVQILSAGDSAWFTPSADKAVSMCSVSSLSSRFVSRVEPLASAERRSKRLVRLFDPGRVISPLIEEMGAISCTILVTRVTLLGLLAEGALKIRRDR